MMNRDVFLSLLALDSYNRGYGQNVGGLLESGQIGTVNIVTRSSIFGEQSDAVFARWQAAGFYAIAYEWQGETIISYRGTNFDPGSLEDLAIAPIVSFLSSPAGKDIFESGLTSPFVPV